MSRHCVGVSHAVLIVDDSRTWTVVPPPEGLTTEILPPSASTRSLRLLDAVMQVSFKAPARLVCGGHDPGSRCGELGPDLCVGDRRGGQVSEARDPSFGIGGQGRPDGRLTTATPHIRSSMMIGAPATSGRRPRRRRRWRWRWRGLHSAGRIPRPRRGPGRFPWQILGKLAATTTRRQRGSGSVGWSRSSTPRGT
jgi:hypothetical protein